MNDTPNRRLQALMAPGAGTILPGAGNALSARFIAAAGFEAVFVSGAAVANWHLGKPDVALTSITELVDHVSAIRDAVDLPIIVDADPGFGNAVNVGRTVRLLERAGASAVMLEDQTFPKRCGHFDGKDVIPAAEMVQKLRAAVDARHDAQMMILARTDARAVEELAVIPREVPGRHVCNMVIGGRAPLLPREALAAMGFAGILYGNAALQAAMQAMREVLSHLRANGSIAGAQQQRYRAQD